MKKRSLLLYLFLICLCTHTSAKRAEVIYTPQDHSTTLFFTDFKTGVTADFINPGGWAKAHGGITSTKYGLKNYLMLNRQYNLNKRTATIIVKLGNDTKLNFFTQEMENTHFWGSLMQIDVKQQVINIYKTYNSDSAAYPAVAISKSFRFKAGANYAISLQRDIFTNVFIVTDLASGISDTTRDSDLKNSGLIRDGFAMATESGAPPVIKSFKVSTAYQPGMHIMYIGDSITEGLYLAPDTANSYSGKLTADDSRIAASSGRSGGRIDGVLNRVRSEIAILKPRYVSVLIGTNGSNTIDKLTQLCSGLIDLGIIPILNNIPWKFTGPVVEDNRMIEVVRRKFNIQGAAFDVATSMDGLNMQQDTSLFKDGIHPNIKGTQKMYLQFKQDVPGVFK